MSITVLFVECKVTGNVIYIHVHTVIRFSLSLLFVCAYCITGFCNHVHCKYYY